jgi:hypothetical protein
MAIETANAAYGVYTEDVPVTDVVLALNHAGFHNEEICLMLARTHPLSTIVREAGLLNANREASALAADVIDWLSGFGAVIRTFGFFIRSRTFLRALETTRKSPALCGSSETFIGLGFSEEDAERLEVQLSQARVLVYVACSESGKATWTKEMLDRLGAQETAELYLGQTIEMAA